MDTTQPIGQRYIDLISNLEDKDFTKKLESLFSPSIKKIINSKMVCSNRTELVKQMHDVNKVQGVDTVNLLELIVGNDNKTNIIRFEITFNDKTTESVISILKGDNDGFIEEINEVFGEKECYQWTSQ